MEHGLSSCLTRECKTPGVTPSTENVSYRYDLQVSSAATAAAHATAADRPDIRT